MGKYIPFLLSFGCREREWLPAVESA